MFFEPSYFQGEEREGFYIKPMMKRFWAVQLEVLHQIDIICKRHNLTYFADWGTLLGAVRHKGYIPWDDDIDLGMMRIDYMKFMSYAKEELPKGFQIISARELNDSNNIITRICNSNYISTDSSFLEQFHGCPYATGVDIFVYDNIPLNKKEEEIQLQLLLSVYILEQHLYNESYTTLLDAKKQSEYLKKIESLCNITFNNEKPIREQIHLLIDNICSMYWDISPKEVTYFLEFLNNSLLRFPVTLFSSFIEVPFENTTIPIPTGYHEILTLEYGDYMTPVRGTASHNYPVYKNQEILLFNKYKKLGLKIPESFRE